MSLGLALGGPELIILLVVILLLFGASRLPKLARSVGQASKELKEGMKEGAGEDADSGQTSGDAPAKKADSAANANDTTETS